MRDSDAGFARYLTRVLLIAAVVAAAISAPAIHAATLPDRLLEATVRVFNLDSQSTGSGVLVGGGEYVVTNWHVVATDTGAPATRLFIAQKVGQQVQRSTITLVWATTPVGRDVALLKIDKPWSKASVAFSTDADRGDEVRAIGFPAVSDYVAGGSEGGPALGQILEPTLNSGSISRVVDKSESFGGAKVLLHQVPINPGNSGGPLFDACGSLVGINSASIEGKSTQGSNVAIHASEIKAGLDAVGVAVVIAAKCSPGGSSWVRTTLLAAGVVTAVLLSGLAVTLALTQRGRTALQRMSRPVSRMLGVPAPPPHAEGTPKGPAPAIGSRSRVRFLSGEYAGRVVDVAEEPLVIGRDPSIRGLVFLGQDSDKISKRHCEIRYDAGRRCFVVTDLGSSNGTFTDGGQRLTAGVPMDLRSGDRLYLADRSVTLELTLT